MLKIQADGADGARGGREANQVILEMLRSMRPDDPILSEESVDDPARLGVRRVWIVGQGGVAASGGTPRLTIGDSWSQHESHFDDGKQTRYMPARKRGAK